VRYLLIVSNIACFVYNVKTCSRLTGQKQFIMAMIHGVVGLINLAVALILIG
jgi:hypothetical protein